jgi:hypothetical protein
VVVVLWLLSVVVLLSAVCGRDCWLGGSSGW